MNKIIFLLLFSLLLIHFTGLTYAKKITTLTELVNPDTIVIDDRQMYIKEGSTVNIYSLKDYKFRGKFGREGEGPKEFKHLAEIIPHPDRLQLNSMNKVSFFTKDGRFIKETKIINGYRFYPLENGFVGRRTITNPDDQLRYITVNLFDHNFRNVKELARMKGAGQDAGKPNVLLRTLAHYTYDNKIFIAAKDGLIIDVYDHTGKLLYPVQKEYKKIKITDKDKDNFRNTIKKRNRAFYEAAKDRWVFPDAFPEIYEFLVADGRVYVLTYKKEGNKREFLVFDVKGKFLKSHMIPLEFKNFFSPYPFTVKNQKMFQLIDSEAEQWELHIVDLTD